jgi:hypothetical protein
MDNLNAIICVLHPVSPLLQVEAHLNIFYRGPLIEFGWLGARRESADLKTRSHDKATGVARAFFPRLISSLYRYRQRRLRPHL